MLARDVPELKPYLMDVSEETNRAIDAGKNVLLEGTQGIQLSLFHGGYPYVTGRDTSAAAICSEAGGGPTKVDNVLLVFKSFMTRVGAGPMPGEISKEEAQRRGWFETAAGTGRDRRSAPFNFELARKAVTLTVRRSWRLRSLTQFFQLARALRFSRSFRPRLDGSWKRLSRRQACVRR